VRTISRRGLLAIVSAGTAVLAGGGMSRAASRHVVLLGDSVFDNAAYVAGGPDVAGQLRGLLPDWRVTLAAVDGHVLADVKAQLARVPADASHLVVSAGGNDALRHAGILDAPARSVADTLGMLADIRARFERDYRAMLDTVRAGGLPLCACTIYDPRYPDPLRRRLATTALSFLNDCIIREAALRGLPLIDLRLVCDDDADFANPIEPSVQGGGKIAAAIAAMVTGHDFGSGRSGLFVR
jgi:hypothetical protein